MDAIDLKIIEILQQNGRATQSEIAPLVGLSQPAVADRIRKLEERGIIVGYAAIVDAAKLGKDITAFVSVGIEHPRFFEAFGEQMRSLPEILECYRVAGPESYLLKVKTDNTKSLDKLLVDTLRTIEGVTHTDTTIALSSIKETTALAIPTPQKAGKQ
ncbi:MAG: Lrp/AsnC family transcriptional regulator [bacterium]|nr:Lrp/AsnC family transcriptional regulator [bacterium]